ncbi:N-acetylglucosamine/diacetylchitobiose ABC transporter substrate-binding protein [Actinophytocola glycyrrhizae]|uniref:N-acetylglucosamine/diacetylchitobiose ABC transporter substrate-binding protein n=1 Tax=Actinophytocola glycyrrhizae TaxID=2044873 RepID=A0ABV9S6L0_9PSEU
MDSENPFHVRPADPLDVVVHKGGYGDAYVIGVEDEYRRRFPSAAITHAGIKKVNAVLEPRFAAGNPPDLISAAGKYSIDFGQMAADGAFLDLGPFLDAPSLDIPGRTVRETLLPGTIEAGTYDGTCFTLNYSCNVFGVLHSRSLFRRHGWTVPRTWDGMYELCAEMTKSGIAPWTYAGDYLLPFLRMLLMTAVRTGGHQVITDIDNLAPNAWRSEAVLEAAAAVRVLADKGWLLPGTEGMTFLEAQAGFVEGKAAFIPCGSWLESEMRDQLPTDFEMVLSPSPMLSENGVVPYSAVVAGAAEPFAVPAKAANAAGGFELLRLLTSRAGGRRFTEATSAPSNVAGAADGVGGSTLLASVRDVLDAAGDNTCFLMFFLWYRDPYYAIGDVTARLMRRELSVREWGDECQALVDAVAADPSVPKYRR